MSQADTLPEDGLAPREEDGLGPHAEDAEDGLAPDDPIDSLRREVRAALDFTPDNAYAVRHLAYAVVQLAVVLAAFHATPRTVPWLVVWFVAFGLTQYRFYFLLHDLCHFALFRGRRTNLAWGRIVAGMLFNSFQSFTAVHTRHHREWGTTGDPGSPEYIVRFRGLGEVLLFFGLPVVGVVGRLEVIVWLPLKRALGLESRGVIVPGVETTSATFRVPKAEIATIVVLQGLLFVAVSGGGARPFDYLFFWCLPVLFVFVPLARLRMYLEHGPLDYAVSDYTGDNARRIARTHTSGFLTAPLFSYMNFRYHREHHLVPGLPSARLPEVYERFTRERLHPDDRAGTYLESLGRLLRLPRSGARPAAPSRSA